MYIKKIIVCYCFLGGSFKSDFMTDAQLAFRKLELDLPLSSNTKAFLVRVHSSL